MYVYVLDKDGIPLQPTNRCGHVRKLLKEKKATCICVYPFVIRLKYKVENPNRERKLTLGIDTGRENIGFSVSYEDGSNPYNATLETCNKNIKMFMDKRREYRSSRRRHRRIRKQRTTLRRNQSFKKGNDDILRSKKPCKSKEIKYPGMTEGANTCKVMKGKEAKFNNRKREDGWLTPSARQLVQCHTHTVKMLQKILPVTDIVVERVSFDFQKLENINIKAWEYSKGPLYSFKDYKDYIYQQQGGKCLLCGKSITQYHHIIYKSKSGSNTVKNFCGLCDDCHENVHNNRSVEEKLLELKEGLKTKYSISLLNSCMGIIIDELNFILPTKVTDGYETFKYREELNLSKDHYIDAYVISLYDSNVNESKLNIDNVYKLRRFKKKSNNNIIKVGKREYIYNGEVVAINRHKAFNQKTDSLEEHINIEKHIQKKKPMIIYITLKFQKQRGLIHVIKSLIEEMTNFPTLNVVMRYYIKKKIKLKAI